MRSLHSGGNITAKWRSDLQRNKVRLVKRRFFRTLIHVLVAGQVLLSAPVVAAIPAGNATAAEMPCADSMPQSPDRTPCPCCPDQTSGVAACLSGCAGAAATISIHFLKPITSVSMPAPAAPAVRLVLLADPPLKPPPIV